MIQIEPNKDARIHWKVYALTETSLKKIKDKVLDDVFDYWKEHATLDKQIFMRKKGVKMTLCHIDNEYALFVAIRNYEDTYHGSFNVSDDKTAKSDLLACMNAIMRNANKFMGAIKKEIANAGN